jgi:hypothetical protein
MLRLYECMHEFLDLLLQFLCLFAWLNATGKVGSHACSKFLVAFILEMVCRCSSWFPWKLAGLMLLSFLESEVRASTIAAEPKGNSGNLTEMVWTGSHRWVEKSATLLQINFKGRISIFRNEFTMEERNLLSFANNNTAFFYTKIVAKLGHTYDNILDLFDSHRDNLSPWGRCGRFHGDQ